MKKRLIAALAVCVLLLSALLPVAAAGIDGTVELKDGEHVAWIDRLDLTHTDAAPLLAFYEDLKEGADHDGEDDFLIEDHPSGYTQNIIEITGSITASADTVRAQVTDIATEILNRYKPFVMAVYDAFDRDHPEVFWLSGERLVGYGMTYSGGIDDTYSYTVTVHFVVQQVANGGNPAFDVRSTAYPTAAAIETAIGQRDAAIDAIMAGATTQSPYTLLQYFNSELTRRNEYNTVIDGLAVGVAPVDSWECISALVGRAGTTGPVCEGYARALKVLCDKAGIACVLVDGNAKSTSTAAAESHMWNYVQVGSAWYAIDVTWNDPVNGATGAVSGLECEDWFLHGSDTVTAGMPFLTSHPVNNQASVEGISFTNGPTLNATACKDPSALPETVLDEITVTNSKGETTVTYGDVLTVMLRVQSTQQVATNQTLALYYKNVKLAESNTATDGVYRLSYNTLERKLPAGEAQTLTLRFTGDKTIADAVTTAEMTLCKAASAVAFPTATHTATYTGSAVTVPTPTVTLLGEDAADTDALTYSYSQENGTNGTGLPTAQGTYQVTVHFAENDWYLGSTGSMTLTVSGGTAAEKPSDKTPSKQEGSTNVKDAASSLVTAVDGWAKGSSLNAVMIVCAAIGLVCILIPILFGRKKSATKIKEKKQKKKKEPKQKKETYQEPEEEDDYEDDEDDEEEPITEPEEESEGRKDKKKR